MQETKSNGIATGSLQASYIGNELQRQFGKFIVKNPAWEQGADGKNSVIITVPANFPNDWFKDIGHLDGVKEVDSMRRFAKLDEFKRVRIPVDSLSADIKRRLEFFKVAEQQAPSYVRSAEYRDGNYVLGVPSDVSRDAFAQWLGIEKTDIKRGYGGLHIDDSDVTYFMMPKPEDRRSPGQQEPKV